MVCFLFGNFAMSFWEARLGDDIRNNVSQMEGGPHGALCFSVLAYFGQWLPVEHAKQTYSLVLSFPRLKCLFARSTWGDCAKFAKHKKV